MHFIIFLSPTWPKDIISIGTVSRNELVGTRVPTSQLYIFLVPRQLDIIFLCYVANFAKDKKAQGKGKKSNERNFQGPMKTQVSAQGCFRTFSRLL